MVPNLIISLSRFWANRFISKMGNVLSSAQNNDELIDNLVSRHSIRSSNVETAFRALDRADYMTPHARDHYEDSEWRDGPLHLSAPCIYSEVMEALELKPGLSFLNIGSGTGYLSTLAGLILGTAGISHGVEVHPRVLEYALEKIQWFLDTSLVLQEIDFCEPKFYLGNGLCLSQPLTGYDRVYCGAGCPAEYENYLKRLIKVGGILVMPLNDTLVQVRRVGENKWTSRSLLNVSFATLRVPNAEDASNPVKLDAQTPVRLQLLARAAIRAAMYRGLMRRKPMLAERLAAGAGPRRNCSISVENINRRQYAWRLLNTENGVNVLNTIVRLASQFTSDSEGDDNQQEPAERPDRPNSHHRDNCNQDNDPRGHDQDNNHQEDPNRDLADTLMESLATETDPGGSRSENTDFSRSVDTNNTTIDTDASRLSADTATTYQMSHVLPAETTPGEATDAIISQDPNSVPPRPDLPGMPSEVEIDLGKMAQTEATTSSSGMVWEETRPDSLEGSEDDTPKSKPNSQKLDSGIVSRSGPSVATLDMASDDERFDTSDSHSNSESVIDLYSPSENSEELIEDMESEEERFDTSDSHSNSESVIESDSPSNSEELIEDMESEEERFDTSDSHSNSESVIESDSPSNSEELIEDMESEEERFDTSDSYSNSESVIESDSPSNSEELIEDMESEEERFDTSDSHSNSESVIESDSPSNSEELIEVCRSGLSVATLDMASDEERFDTSDSHWNSESVRRVRVESDLPSDSEGLGFDLRRRCVAVLMQEALQVLPLPHPLKRFVNFGRDHDFSSGP